MQKSDLHRQTRSWEFCTFGSHRQKVQIFFFFVAVWAATILTRVRRNLLDNMKQETRAIKRPAQPYKRDTYPDYTNQEEREQEREREHTANGRYKKKNLRVQSHPHWSSNYERMSRAKWFLLVFWFSMIFDVISAETVFDCLDIGEKTRFYCVRVYSDTHEMLLFTFEHTFLLK